MKMDSNAIDSRAWGPAPATHASHSSSSARSFSFGRVAYAGAVGLTATLLSASCLSVRFADLGVGFATLTLSAMTGAGLALLTRRGAVALRQIVRSEVEISYLRHVDALTGLANRGRFTETLAMMLDSSSQPVVLALCDLDAFKGINDLHGFEKGDLTLKSIAAKLRSAFPESVLVSRFAGDEFAIASNDPALNPDRLCSTIAQALKAVPSIGERAGPITACIGIAKSSNESVAGDLLRDADIALSLAKKEGRSAQVVHQNQMTQQAFAQRDIEIRITDVLNAGRFDVHYQPIVDGQTGEPCGLEALLRWPTDDIDPLTPDVFIPAAERAGIMPLLGDWVLARAFADSLRWPELSISINLSPLQIQAPDLIDRLQHHLRATGANPERIVFEITEGVLLDPTSAIRSTLDRLTQLGFQLALDDFGTGYSALSYLRNFPFKKLKIDKSFITGRINDPVDVKLVKAIIEIGRSLGMTVVAEGVETHAEASTLRDLQCDQMQGYCFGRASTPADAQRNLDILRRRARKGRPISLVAA